MIKLREQAIGEDRINYLLYVAAEYISEHCPDGSIFYDDAECDGYCLSDELMAEVDEEYNVFPTAPSKPE